MNDFEIWYADTFATPEEMQEAGRSSAVPSKQRPSGSPQKVFRDPAMDDDETPEQREREGIDVDNDALAYIRARKNVMTLAHAKKVDRM